MRALFLVILFVGMLGVSSYATSVSVSTSSAADRAGLLTYIYFENANAGTTSTPTADTSLAAPSTTGSYVVNRGNTVYLWSTPFSTSRTIPAGSWVLDLWALAAKSGSMTVSILVTNAAGTTVATVLSSGTTSSIGTTKAQVATTFSGSSVTVPANDYILVKLTAPTGTSNPTSFTIYWGKAQLTDFQVIMSSNTA